MTVPNTFHPLSLRLLQPAVLDFAVGYCYLLFDMDCRDLFSLLRESIVALSKLSSWHISCLARHMASLRIPSLYNTSRPVLSVAKMEWKSRK
jgi:hypothetical protein